MYKILITGASSFIGVYLVNKLIERKVDISILVRNKNKIDNKWADSVNVYEGDITERKSMAIISKNIDIIFHLVAVHIHEKPRSKEEKRYIYKVNVEGTRNLLEEFRCCLKHFIFFSSISVYDGYNGTEILNENSKVMPNNDYGRTKLISEKLVGEYGKKYGFMATSLRFPFVYGPGNKGNILRMIKGIAKRKFILVGRGDNKRSAIYVENAVDSALSVMGNVIADGKNYIVTDGMDYTLKELYAVIAQSLNRKTIPVYLPLWIARIFARIGDGISRFFPRLFPLNSEVLAKLTVFRCFSSEKICEEIGFSPKYNFFNTINITINWYKETI